MNLNVLKTILFTLSIVLSAVCRSQGIGIADEKQLEVSLRMIGHELLLSSGDSTTRVLPLVKDEDGYRIQFANDFALEPNDLVTITDRVLSKSGMVSEYVVEVEDCDSMQVVYAFKVDNTTNSDIIPCRRRDLPKGCYSLLISFPVLDFLAVETSENKTAEAETEESNLFFWLFMGLVIMIIVVTAYKRKKKSVPHSENPNLVSLGKYHFDKLNAELIIEEQRIELTSKEADLLMLLYDTVNTTVEREVLLNRVWGDEGDYIGRTLDVFISKLRKKLEFDTQVKIVNVRGVGYKLVMDV
jgi:hypothetical protein